MALRRDSPLTKLNRNGYSVVLLDREGIEPLDVLGQDQGCVNGFGTIRQIWTLAAPLPKRSAQLSATDVMGTTTDYTKLLSGLGLLSNVLIAMGTIIDLPKLNLFFRGLSVPVVQKLGRVSTSKFPAKLTQSGL